MYFIYSIFEILNFFLCRFGKLFITCLVVTYRGNGFMNLDLISLSYHPPLLLMPGGKTHAYPLSPRLLLHGSTSRSIPRFRRD